MKKYIALLCAFIVVFSSVTTVAFAENDDTENGATSNVEQTTTVESTEGTTDESTKSTTAESTESTTAEPTTESTEVTTETTTEAETEVTTEAPTTEISTETNPPPQLKPAEPKLISLANTTGGILFKWNETEGANSYRVYKRGAGERYWTYLATVSDTSYLDNKVASGNYYRYTVIAVNDGGFSTYHSGLVIKRLANPYNIKLANNIDNVTVTWGRINGANGYRVYRRTAGSKYWTCLGTQTTTTYIDKNVTPNAYYRYTVRSAYGNTFSDYSTTGALTLFVETPKPMRITTLGAGVSFTWSKVMGAQSYRVYRRGAGEKYWTYLGTTNNNTFFDQGVKKGNYYRYTVKAVRNSYMSGYDTVGVTVKFMAVSGMIVHGRYDNYLKPGTITKPTIISVDPNNWELTIVNSGYRIPKGYTPNLTYVCGSGERLDKNVAVHYERMYNAARAQGVYLTPCSGYRSYSTQETLFNRKINLYMNQGYNYNDAVVKAATIVMPPGSSEHNLGYAMDIVCVEEWFENTREFAWLQQNAADYGFILRYPKNKQHITKVIYEPWHWRYVGVPAAHAMKESGLVLEEYLGVVN